MVNQLITALKATLVIAFLTGLAFPISMTFLAQMLFPEQANGSLVRDISGRIIGSKLIGQCFNKAEYFHSRPSAAGTGYSGEASSGTNLGPVSAKLIMGIADDPATPDKDESYEGIKQLSERYRKDNFLAESELAPVDAVTRSGSGLDPHISGTNAMLQARRVAKARGISESKLQNLIQKYTEPRQLGFLGEPRVNVLLLNLALDKNH